MPGCWTEAARCHDALSGLLVHQRPGGLLDALFDADVALFRAGMDLIFGRQWMSAGQEPGLPGPGEAPILVLHGVSARNPW